MSYFKHETAIVDEGAKIGDNTKIWYYSHICGNATIGDNCNIGQSVFVDNNSIIGDNCKLQNNVNIYDGVTLENYVFCGPSMTFTNVKIPRCKYPRDRNDKFYLKTVVREGASIGAHAVIVCGIEIGKNALIGSGAVVSQDVKPYSIVVGNPARHIGWACECGIKLDAKNICKDCGKKYLVKSETLEEQV